jgi:hypothetical protein
VHKKLEISKSLANTLITFKKVPYFISESVAISRTGRTFQNKFFEKFLSFTPKNAISTKQPFDTKRLLDQFDLREYWLHFKAKNRVFSVASMKY